MENQLLNHTNSNTHQSLSTQPQPKALKLWRFVYQIRSISKNVDVNWLKCNKWIWIKSVRRIFARYRYGRFRGPFKGGSFGLRQSGFGRFDPELGFGRLVVSAEDLGECFLLQYKINQQKQCNINCDPSYFPVSVLVVLQLWWFWSTGHKRIQASCAFACNAVISHVHENHFRIGIFIFASKTKTETCSNFWAEIFEQRDISSASSIHSQNNTPYYWIVSE